MSALKINRDIHDSPLRYQNPYDPEPMDVVTHTLYIPKIFSGEDRKNFENIAETCTSIFSKVIDAYKEDPEVRKLFGFSPELEELILRDPGYETRVPMLRVDIFYNEETGDFKFCEFNTDGTSAMFENEMMASFMKDNDAWNHFRPNARSLALMQPWVDAVAEIWKQARKRNPELPEKPAVIVTDFLENAYYPELVAFRDLFAEDGYVCELEDIRSLRYDGSRLYSEKTGQKYDLIYRRAVTRDVMEHIDEVQDVLKALRDGKVIAVGDFQTQVIHSKMIDEALQSDLVLARLSEEEREFLDRHQPHTYELTPELAEKMKEDKNLWIIKPKDSYAAKGIYAGVELPQKIWEQEVDRQIGTDCIVQDYVPHYQTLNIDLLGDEGFRNYGNLTGLYIYNGKFAGVYSRLSASGIVSTQYNEKMVPTFFEEEEEPER